MSKATGDYQIGFGRPPTHTQFKKGKSGNPKGRPKGSTNLEASLLKALMKPTKLQEGDRTTIVPRIVGISEVLLGKAAAGDTKLYMMFLGLSLRLAEAEALRQEATRKGSADEMPIMEKFSLLLRQTEARLHGREIGARPLPGQEILKP